MKFNKLSIVIPAYNEGQTIHKIDLFCPKITNTQCYDKFPCAPRLDNSFSLRGEELQDGFVPEF